MARPTLTFACELGRDRVEDFFADGPVVGALQDLGARVALALADFSPPRHARSGGCWNYGPEAAAIAVGSTGGGPDIPGQPQVPALSYDDLSRDLRLAARWTDQVYVHSLEGCVDHRYLDRLAGFDWTPGERPALAGTAAALRVALQGTLWSSAHPRQLGLGASVVAAGIGALRCRAARRG